MAKAVRRKAPAKPQGVFARAAASIKRFPVQSALGGAAALVAMAVGAFELGDRFFGKPRVDNPVAVALVDTELAPLSGGSILVSDDGRRAFAGGVKLRLQFSLREPIAHAVINSISVASGDAVPESVTGLVAAGTGAASTEEFSWAGSRTVDSYMALLGPNGAQVRYIAPTGAVQTCLPQNILDCGDQTQVVELDEGGDSTHTIDLQLAYRDKTVRGISFVVSYAVDGEQHEARTDPLFVYN